MYILGAVSAVSLWYTLWFMCIVIFISLHQHKPLFNVYLRRRVRRVPAVSAVSHWLFLPEVLRYVIPTLHDNINICTVCILGAVSPPCPRSLYIPP